MPALAANLNTTATMSNAEFQAINTFVSGQLDLGLPKTADSGQINPATANFPGSNLAEAGYEIREMADQLQASHPLLFRFGYRRGASADAWSLALTIGKGSDGAGNILNQLLAETLIPINDATGTIEWAVSCDEDRFIICADSTGATGGIVGFERTVDPATKVRTNKGLIGFSKVSGTGFITTRVIPYTGSVPAPEATAGIKFMPMPIDQISGVNANGNVATYPMIFQGIGEPMIGANFHGVFAGDYPVGVTYSPVSILGQDQAMKVMRYTGMQGMTNALGRLAYRFD